MRELQECQAEVFRRSEKRIKERRQHRKRAVMTCVPLALCAAALSALLIPGMYDFKQAPESVQDPYDGAVGNPSGAEAAMGTLGEYSQSITCSVAQIQVSGDGDSHTYTDMADVLRISNQLLSYSTVIPEYNGTENPVRSEGDMKENADDVIGGIADSANAAYTITLITHEGVKTEYRLFGNTLRNQTTNQAYTLTNEQAKELREILGILQ